MSAAPAEVDFLVVGAGIAGASIAYWLAREASVLLVERESQPGYHSTGRSAALFEECYGPPQVRALTRASRAFFEQPPAGFAAQPILRERGAMFVGRAGQQAAAQALFDTLRVHSPRIAMLNGDAIRARVPVLRAEHAACGVADPDAADMDVNGLHQGFLRGVKAAGGQLWCDAPLRHAERCGAHWWVQVGQQVGAQVGAQLGEQSLRASVIVNAAGAWADAVAALAGAAPQGIEPRRRAAFTFAPPAGLRVADWPAVVNLDESYYFKPDAGVLLGSPANADPMPPCDVQPEELDIARGIHAIEEATTLQIRRPLRTWAGLRSFSPSGDLVGGYDPACPGFFWVAGQGGYGIQTSAAMGEACAALALGRAVPQHLMDHGVAPTMFLPAHPPATVRATSPAPHPRALL